VSRDVGPVVRELVGAGIEVLLLPRATTQSSLGSDVGALVFV